jgi:hypothetical protein
VKKEIGKNVGKMSEREKAGERERGKSLSFDTAYKILDKLSAL